MKLLTYFFLCLLAFSLMHCNDGVNSDVVTPGSGTGGSMAQFTISKGHLYTLQSGQLTTLSLLNPAAPEATNTLSVGEDAETLFPSGDELYIGTQNGIHMYSLANPAQPAFLGTYRHFTACDPVVVEGGLAYSTLREGNCRGFINELQIINIQNPAVPQLITQYAMDDPHGLAVQNGILYICEGDYGLKVIDARLPEQPSLLSSYPDFHGYDAILTPASLLVVGNDGLAQYAYQDPTNLTLLSFLPVEKRN